jgi:hypothetical protein
MSLLDVLIAMTIGLFLTLILMIDLRRRSFHSQSLAPIRVRVSSDRRRKPRQIQEETFPVNDLFDRLIPILVMLIILLLGVIVTLM